MNEIFSTLFLGLATIPVTIGGVLFVGLVLHWGRGREQGLMPYIFYSTFLVLALETMLSGRVLNQQIGLDGMEVVEVLTKHPLTTWLGRANSLFILFSACERIAARFLCSGPKSDIPVLLLVAIWLFFLTNVASPGFLGAHPKFSHECLYVIIASTGAALLYEQEGKSIIDSARNTLFVFIMLSAVISIFHPEMMFDMNYNHGIIPRLSIRYYGLSSHANAFALIISMFLFCLWHNPFSSAGLNFLGWTIGILSLLLTQSKTCWIVMVVCIIILSYFRYGTFFKRFLFDARRPQFLAALLIVAILLTGILGYITMFTSVSDKMVSFFSTKQGSEILSFTGRDQIWKIALQEWRRTPLFGYGLTIWDEQYRARIGLSYAVSAHSQFYQSLSSAGIIGVVGFMSYILLLLSAVVHTARLTKGLSAALFLMIFLRSFSEPSIMMDSFGPEGITNLFIIMVMATHYGHRPVKNPVTTIFYSRRSI